MRVIKLALLIACQMGGCINDANAKELNQHTQIDLDVVTVIANTTKHEAETAILGDTELFDLPLSASALNADDFAERIPDDIADLADYAPGVSRRANYWGVNTPTFQLRGFNAGDATAYYKDGFRYQGRGPMSMANVEGVEILRGPVNALYGWNEAGGAVQVLVKKPTDESIKTLSLQYDAFGKGITTLDLGGALNNSTSYRFIASREQGNSFRDAQHAEQILIAPSLAFDFEHNKKLELALEFLDDKRTTDYGIPAFGGKPANVPSDRIYTENFGEQHSQSTRFSSRYSQNLWGGEISAAFSYYSFKYLTYNDAEPYAVSGTQILRTYEDYPEQYRWLTSYVDYKKTFKWGDTLHKFATRLELARETRELKNGVFDEYPSIDIFNPVYNQTYTRTADYNLFSQGWKNKNIGIAVQDEFSLGKVSFLIGLRQNYLKQTHYLNEALPVVINNHELQTDTATTPKLGITWHVYPTVNIYASYSGGKNAVLPQNRAVDNKSFKPTDSKQLELGIKMQPVNNAWLASLAVFNIERQNVLTRDPDNVGFSVQTGRQKSRGVEMSFQGAIAENWQLTGQATLLDAFIAEDNRYEPGNRLPYAARVGASFWLNHTMHLDDNAKLSLSGGLVYQGNRYANFANTTVIPSYTRLDLGASYQTQDWIINLGLENALDKNYYSSGVENRPAVIYPGAPRTLAVKVGYNFN